MKDYTFLGEDPRPELEKDTLIWRRLLRTIPLMNWTVQRKESVSLMQWSLRSAGTLIRPSTTGYRFEPVFDEKGFWIDQAMFDAVKKIIMSPYRVEIRELLQRIEG